MQLENRVILVGENPGVQVMTITGHHWIPGDYTLATSEEGSLHVVDGDRTVVLYAPGNWTCARRIHPPAPVEPEEAPADA